MGLFSFFGGPNINQGIEDFKATPGALLLDVRTPQEYKGGHIPGSKNVPLQTIGSFKAKSGKDTPLFVYCQSGARSSQATSTLKQAGYTSVTNIGGISSYRGDTER